MPKKKRSTTKRVKSLKAKRLSVNQIKGVKGGATGKQFAKFN
jgi:hypothetical protein